MITKNSDKNKANIYSFCKIVFISAVFLKILNSYSRCGSMLQNPIVKMPLMDAAFQFHSCIYRIAIAISSAFYKIYGKAMLFNGHTALYKN